MTPTMLGHGQHAGLSVLGRDGGTPQCGEDLEHSYSWNNQSPKACQADNTLISSGGMRTIIS